MTIEYDEGSGIPCDGFDGGDLIWKVNGKFHREGGPAIIRYHGTKHWYRHGKLHRVDGPAIEWSCHSCWWHYKGVRVRFQIFNAKIGSPADTCDNIVGIVIRHVEGIFWEVLIGNQKKLAYCQESI